MCQSEISYPDICGRSNTSFLEITLIYASTQPVRPRFRFPSHLYHVLLQHPGLQWLQPYARCELVTSLPDVRSTELPVWTMLQKGGIKVLVEAVNGQSILVEVELNCPAPSTRRSSDDVICHRRHRMSRSYQPLHYSGLLPCFLC